MQIWSAATSRHFLKALTCQRTPNSCRLARRFCYSRDALIGETNQALVEFRDVSFGINGGPSIIDRLNFTVAAGETLVLLGESGCGKTTTLRLVNRLLAPTAGQVLVEGKATTQWDVIQLRRRTGYVIQEAGLFPHFTVAENVGLVPWLDSWNQQHIDERVTELLSLVGLEPSLFGGRYPRELSGGSASASVWPARSRLIRRYC